MSKPLLDAEQDARVEAEMDRLKLPPAERAWLRNLLAAMEECPVGGCVSIDTATNKIEVKYPA